MTTIVLAVRQGCLIACCFLPVSPLFAQDDQPQWRQLPLITDGKIDPTWKHLWGGGFSVMDDGSLRTDCTDAGMGLLLYQKQRLGNCRIRVVFRSEKAQSNAGVYVRIDDGVLERADDPLPLRERIDDGRLTKQTLARIEASSDAELEAWYPVHHGYEVQIYDAGDAYHRTGALYSLAPAAEIPEPRGEPWRPMIITLEGNRILVEVDGKQVTKFDPDSRDIPPRKHWSEPRREHTRPPAGFIGLQNHDPGDVVYFKAVSVAPLRRPSSENGSDINSSGDNAASAARPFDGLTFHGRIAYSADGNHNDPDDWASSPVALAILAQAGLKDRLVHFDYNCILTDNDSRWARTHADSVLGAVQQYGYDRTLFHDCQKDRDAAIDSIARAIDASSAGDTLYFIVAGPMELPFLGIQKSRPDKRQFVGCISHSRWNDGFAKDYTFTHTKRNIIATGVKWIQIPDQNPTLACSKYGQPARSEEFQPFFWMRDSDDARLKFLWERLVVSTRPDCSDAGMAWFLATGDDVCEVEELRKLLEDGQLPAPIGARQHIRLEAECFLNLDGYELEYRDDRQRCNRALG